MIDRLTEALSDRYRVERELGAGGMATVYLADDLKHDRKVAIKVLRPELAAVVGAERFLSEIRTTANLQHPHILPLFDSGEAGGFLYYVMPFMAGETLRDRIDREKQLSVDDAVAIAAKVSSALAYAHRNGVIHRDIKPANILLEDGEPQVADFGIALAVQQAGGGRLTETGLSLGTPYYMSPEQATGDRDPDPRSDMYSVGCVTFEMLTGDPPFSGSTAQSVLAKILTDDAPLVTTVRRSVPLHVASAVSRATQRLPADRFPDMSEFISALNDPGYRYGDLAEGAAAGSAESGGGGRIWQVATAALAVLVVALTGVLSTRGGTTSEFEPLTLRVTMPDSQRMLNPVDYLTAILSDDGSALVYSGPEYPVGEQLWVKFRGESDAIPIRGTSDPLAFTVSPDGSQIAFVQSSSSALRVVSSSGGSPRVVADSAQSIGIDWAPDGFIYFTDAASGISRVPETGGDVERLANALEQGNRDLTWPNWLPGDRHILLTRWGNTPASDSIAVLNRETGEVRSIAVGVRAEYANSGHMLISTNDQSVSWAPFDPRAGELTGSLRPLLGQVRSMQSGGLDFQVGASGTLLYVSGGGRRSRPVWVDRTGEVTAIEEDWLEDFTGFALSPDGSRLAVSVAEGPSSDLWVRSSSPGDNPPQRVTFGETDITRPAWSASGDTVFYVGALEGATSAQILARRPDGTGEVSVVLDVDQLGGTPAPQEVDLSDDGRWLVYRVGGGVASRDIMVFERGVDSVGRPLIAENFNEHSPMLSPDGRFLVHGSSESGEEEIYVRTFPDISGGRWLVSSGGGAEPVWSADGRAIYYRNRVGEMIQAVWSEEGGVLSRDVLFDARRFVADPVHPAFDIHPDGRFLMGQLADNSEIGVVWIENFVEQLRRMEESR